METLISPIVYPDSDGQPMANNTEHLERIATTKYGLESAFAERDDVFVAADLFWYPVEGMPRIVLAPDVIVAFGRPKGDRKSYQQWKEGNIAPQVVFEFLSDSNTPSEMTNKALFFERYGVQEYYLYDLERKQLSGFIRYQEHDDKLEEVPAMNDWVSPRLGIRFDMSSGDLQLYKPDGKPFLSYAEVEIELNKTREMLDEAREMLGETRERLGETQERLGKSETRAKMLEAKLRELGINPDTL
jgi:Uma2 family endonuclease